jgi:predicted AAA+ superfamily ATPase
MQFLHDNTNFALQFLCLVLLLQSKQHYSIKKGYAVQRDAMQALQEWKSRANRKPLILQGARQVGKTWLMEEFAKGNYERSIRLSFNEDDSLEQRIFVDENASRIIERLEIDQETTIEPQSTLLIFDEIQEAPKALASLKSFCERKPEYQIICAGSLLGISLHAQHSFPVGKVEFLDVYPMTFIEFLRAIGRDKLADLLASSSDWQMLASFHDTLIEQLKSYLFIGGMPEVVSTFVQNCNYQGARQIQKQILRSYDLDFSKHAPHEIVPRIRKLFATVPAQLGREKKRFVYSNIEPGARSSNYDTALQWLVDAGIARTVKRVSTPKLPLAAYEDIRAFKLFIHDVGLLGCMSGLEASTILDGDEMFIEHKGALAEQFALNELVAGSGFKPWYWTNERNSAEIDFLIEHRGRALPLEVKSGTSRHGKSLRAYRDHFSPHVSLRASLRNLHRDDWLLNIPLYLLGELERILESEDIPASE